MDEELEFDETSHIYLYNGIILTSVTQLLKRKWNSYVDVPKKILEQASQFGSNVHSAVECHGKGLEIPKLSIYENLCYEEYLRLVEKHNIVPLENEKIVHCGYRYAGCLDLICEIEGKLCIADVKTTSYVHEEEVQMQMSLYNYALKSMGYDKQIETSYVVWLPRKKSGELKEIKLLSDEEVERFLSEVEEHE